VIHRFSPSPAVFLLFTASFTCKPHSNQRTITGTGLWENETWAVCPPGCGCRPVRGGQWQRRNNFRDR